MLELTKRAWNANKETYIWIFNVGRGFSSFVKTPDNYGMMIDCGSTEGSRPFQDIIAPHFLDLVDRVDRKTSLAQVIVTHPHSDHCMEIESVLQAGKPYLLTCPHSNPKEHDRNQHVNWELVSNPHSGADVIDLLKTNANKRKPPLRAHIVELGMIVPDFDMQIFFIPPKANEMNLPKTDYANNLSIVVYLRNGRSSILFMGDLMPSGCEWLLANNDSFKKVIRAGITIIVAPHHGLKSGFCQALYDAMPAGRVNSVHLISEKRGAGETEGDTHPKYLSSELALGHNGRFSYSTKNDGHLRVILGAGNRFTINSSTDINDLL